MTTIIYGSFEWDAGKAALNLRKHEVSFEEATTIFADPNYVLAIDRDEPDRILALGMSGLLRLVLVVHVENGPRVRIISARRATNTEVKSYEKKHI